MSIAFCRLPLDCLLEIFLYCRDGWPPCRIWDEGGETVYTAGWMLLTHVCSIFREVGAINLSYER